MTEKQLERIANLLYFDIHQSRKIDVVFSSEEEVQAFRQLVNFAELATHPNDLLETLEYFATAPKKYEKREQQLYDYSLYARVLNIYYQARHPEKQATLF